MSGHGFFAVLNLFFAMSQVLTAPLVLSFAVEVGPEPASTRG
jgi:hypothetical protein